VSGAFFGESFGLRFAYGALGGSPTRFCSTPDQEDVWINAVNECHYKRLNDDVISLTIFGGAAEETDLRVRQKAWRAGHQDFAIRAEGEIGHCGSQFPDREQFALGRDIPKADNSTTTRACQGSSVG
jgi:hypothetical protein